MDNTNPIVNESKYLNSKIYKIVSISTEKCYIGSTFKKLSTRLCQHERDYERRDKTSLSSFEIIKYGNASIILLGEYPCDTKKQLLNREGFWIRNSNCVNKNIAGRTKKQYKIDNHDRLILFCKQRREKNKDIINLKSKQYRINNLEKMKKQQSKKIVCECGSVIRTSGISEHRKRTTHMNFLNNIN